ncbi:MAG: M3 family metallopeptidase [Bacteroidota bacterium]
MIFDKKSFTVLFLFLLSVLSFSMPTENPVLHPLNQAIDFKSITARDISSATDEVLAASKNALEKIYSIPKEKRTYYNSLLALDDIYNNVSGVQSIVNLMLNVNPDESVRNACKEAQTKLDAFNNNIALDETLYNALKQYSKSADAGTLSKPRKKFLNETIQEFERSGFRLPAEKRASLKDVQNKLSELSMRFATNIAEYSDSLVLDESGMAGLPDDYKNARRRSDGKYVIDMSYPSYFPFMRLAKSDEARKSLYTKFLNIASDKNISLLKEILYNRKVLSYILGYQTYAQYALEPRMAQNAKNVWEFEDNLIAKLRPKAEKDFNELIQVKRKVTNDPAATAIQPWEAAYYRNILLKDNYSLDPELVKEYFSVDDVISGMFKTAQHLFDIQFRQVDNASVWHKDVKMYEVIDNDKVIARFYLDLYPRDNKFNHAGCFNILKGKSTSQGYQLPAVALVCNFPAATSDKPALMPHSDVTTFFHEFGHALHAVLTQSELSAFSGTSVSMDFVETPSQIFENWAWNYDVLKTFAHHYKTREPLPEDLYRKMIDTKNVTSGIMTLYQVLYGEIDMTLHDHFNTKGSLTTTDIVRELHNKILPYPFTEGTNFEAGFGHLIDYAAGYYSYLWAEVYAQDMFSIFEQNGVMDKQTGRRFREQVLAKGSTEKESDIVRTFLQREPKQDAFLKSLGL